MKIISDEALLGVQDAFGRFGEVITVPGRAITREVLGDAEVLLVRSVTRVGESLIRGSRLRFVASATSGFDHLDIAALERAGIAWAHAPGCNAQAVAEYVCGSLAVLAGRLGESLQGKRLAVVGLGQTGRRVAAGAEALGLQVCAFDPFVQQERFTMLAQADAVLDADVISLHVPLTLDGPCPTRHWLDAARIDRLRPGTWLINASRGEVLDNRALRDRLETRADLHAVLDVWEGEPDPDAGLLSRADIATPHIAGYSLAGKYRGLAMIHEAFCRWHQASPQWQAPALPSAGSVTLLAGEGLDALLRRVSDVPSLDGRFRAAMASTANRAAAFDACRREAAARPEFSAWELQGLDPRQCAAARQLGFAV